MKMKDSELEEVREPFAAMANHPEEVFLAPAELWNRYQDHDVSDTEPYEPVMLTGGAERSATVHGTNRMPHRRSVHETAELAVKAQNRPKRNPREESIAIGRSRANEIAKEKLTRARADMQPIQDQDLEEDLKE